MILIYPPVAKPSEPPAGIAKIAGVLTRQGVVCRTLDANLEGLLYLTEGPPTGLDTWTKRAVRNLSRNLAGLRDPETYHNLDRYKRAVLDVNRVLEMSAAEKGVISGMADYEDPSLSPMRSADLIRAAEAPEKNLFYPYFQRRLLELLEERSARLIGFSLNYLSQALCTFAMIGFLRQRCPGVALVLGGGLVTSWMRSPTWPDPFKGLVEHMVAGPGEYRLLSLLGVDPARGEHSTPAYDSLRTPDYLAPGFILPYSASSGCYWNRCSFCPEKAEGNQYVPVPADTAADDLHRLVMETRPILVHLLDNAVSPALMEKLSGHPPGAPWYGFARVSRHLTDLDFCIALRRSGCLMLKLGLESGDQGVLDGMEKGIDLETVSRALRALKRAGIATYVYLLFGTPAETVVEARRTLEFTVEHRNEIGFLNLAVFNMPVCAPEARRIETRSFYEGDLSLYTDFSHPNGWHRKLVRQFLDTEFKRHGAVKSILKRNPPLFTSNHAPFFVTSPMDYSPRA